MDQNPVPHGTVSRAPQPTNNCRQHKFCIDEIKLAEICALLSIGLSVRTAAAYVGCAVGTIYRTARKKPAVAEALRAARARGEVRLMSRLEKASEGGDRKATTWMLLHNYPDRYCLGKRKAMTPEQLSGVLSQLMEILIREIRDADERRRIAARMDELTASLIAEATIAGQVERDE